jgi:ribosomal protein L37AE/L43A
MAKLQDLLTCAECSKQKRDIKKYPRSEIVEYNGRKLCPACYKQAVENEKFRIFICELFGVKWMAFDSRVQKLFCPQN